jgi:hypothetical protein
LPDELLVVQARRGAFKKRGFIGKGGDKIKNSYSYYTVFNMSVKM